MKQMDLTGAEFRAVKPHLRESVFLDADRGQPERATHSAYLDADANLSGQSHRAI